MKIQKIIIEGFHNVTRKEYEFEDINYIHGRNGAGKSTILQAIQLGLLGYVPGSNKTKQGVFAHSNNHTMAVKLILDNNISIQRVWTQTKSSVSETVTVVPEGYEIESLIQDIELPLFNFDEFSHMTANALKDWFINYLPKQTFTTDWSTVLTDAVAGLPDGIVDTDLLTETVETIKQFGLSGVEEIRRVNEYLKTMLSFSKKELDKKISTIQSLIHYDDYVEQYTEGQLKDLIRDTEHRIIQLHVQGQNTSKIVDLEQKISHFQELAPTVESKEAELEDIQKGINRFRDRLESKRSEYTSIIGECRGYESVINSSGICTFTQKKCNEISSMVEEYKIKVAELQETAQVVQKEIDYFDSNVRYLTDKLRVESTNLNSLKSELSKLAEYQSELETLRAKASSSESEDIVSLETRLESYKEMYGKAVANRQYNELNDVVIKDRYRLENTVECLKIWINLTGVNGLQAQGDYNPFDILSGSINPVLSQMFGTVDARCKFYSDGKANSFSFGIERPSEGYVPYTMLSSGEKCLFLMSLFIGLLNYTKSPLKLILIDDLLDHLDDANFNSALETIKQMKDIQFIFAGVKPSTVENFHCIEI